MMEIPSSPAELNRTSRPPVEVVFSRRCWHGCFQVVAASPMVWRWPNHKQIETLPGRPLLIHISAHGEPGESVECQRECFQQ